LAGAATGFASVTANTGFAPAHLMRALRLRRQGVMPAHSLEFDKAWARSTQKIRKHNTNLGKELKASGGQRGRHRSLYRRCLKKPDFEDAHYNMGMRARAGKERSGKEGVGRTERSCMNSGRTMAVSKKRILDGVRRSAAEIRRCAGAFSKSHGGTSDVATGYYYEGTLERKATALAPAETAPRKSHRAAAGLPRAHSSLDALLEKGIRTRATEFRQAVSDRIRTLRKRTTLGLAWRNRPAG